MVQIVGWVERSATHHFKAQHHKGLRFASPTLHRTQKAYAERLYDIHSGTVQYVKQQKEEAL